MTRIAIADDHAVVRKGLRQFIVEAQDMTVVGEAASGDELLTVLRSRAVDVVVLDLSLGMRSGLDLLKHIKSEFPRLPVVILSMHSEDLFAVRALRAGASGYVEKNSAPEELLNAIRRIARGGTYVSARISEKIAADISRGGAVVLPHERLSDRELEVLRLLGSGMSVTEIAHSLNLSVKTVSTHRTHVLTKTGLRSNADIVEYVISHGLR
ncbi:MAG: two-component system, NarL family, invasion response regulator UvrY [Thermoanaerobaculia bacterium]|jgi:DNA-binding NarL/FixJ family response regulator|nr:two-component system, NarL family, invasion response regulator UvrY [Thermoanaerobaculia bacterium]